MVETPPHRRTNTYSSTLVPTLLGSPQIGAGPTTVRKHQIFEGANFQRLLEKGDKSKLFINLPISDDEIKAFPKKLRPYYEHLALLKDHYEEVDTLLASSLPSTIATSFKPAQSTYTRLLKGPELKGPNGHAPPQRGNEESLRGDEEEANGNGDRQDGEGEGEEEPLLMTNLQREEARDKVARFALNVNFAINILLLIAKGLAVLTSSSISLLASFIDALLDFTSTLIILGTSLAMGTPNDRHTYPAGKRRFEPLGVLIFSAVMTISFMQVFIESFKRAVGKEVEEVAELSWFGIGTMVATIVIKSVVWVWCKRIPSSSIQALAQDAENDVFFNMMSLAFPWIGEKLQWKLLDPIGGMVLSLYIIQAWLKTMFENFANLSGKRASPDEFTRILYLCTRFRSIKKIGAVEVYHIGDELIVEVDAILPETSSLHYAHDVAETLQCLLESLDHVARSYVHVDYDAYNPPQHTARTLKKKSPSLPDGPPADPVNADDGFTL